MANSKINNEMTASFKFQYLKYPMITIVYNGKQDMKLPVFATLIMYMSYCFSSFAFSSVGYAFVSAIKALIKKIGDDIEIARSVNLYESKVKNMSLLKMNKNKKPGTITPIVNNTITSKVCILIFP